MSLMTHPLYQPEIVHGIRGRLRIRVPSLQTSPGLKAALEAQVKATPAVETVRVSVPTDCIIISYRPQEPGVTQAQIYQLITQITQEFFATDCNHQPPVEAIACETDVPPEEPEIAPPVPVSQVPETVTITQPEPLVLVTNEIHPPTHTEIAPESPFSHPEPEVDATASPTATPELESDDPELESPAPQEEAPMAVIPEANLAASLPPDEPVESSTTTPSAKAPRRTSPTRRKPRTRKKPEPPTSD